ncbi:MAG: hypothetical protein ACK5AO_06720 [bacterium]|jgi:hypothetical protein
MKFYVSIILSAAIAFSLGLFLPWWSIAVAGFLTGFFIPQHKFLAFLSSFLGVFILWGSMALYISYANDHILAKRIALLVIKNNDHLLLILLTALIGGITTGLSAFTARTMSIVFKK